MPPGPSAAWTAARAAPAELPEVASLLARAFTDDPLWTWALARADAAERRARLDRFFAALLRHGLWRHELVWAVAGAGAAAWAPPERWRFGLLEQARMAPAVLGAFGGAVGRLLRLQHRVERAHLREPHYYLFAIGVDPAHQGRGVGAALLAPMLARCDAEAMPAYLESSNPANLTFYRRHGFVAMGEIRCGDGPLLTLMRRAPRA